MAPTPIQLLKPREREILERFLEIGDLPAAIEASGYAKSSAANMASVLRHTPEFVAALHTEVARQLVQDAVLARKVVVDILNDKDAPQKLKGDLAVKLLDRSGHVAPKAKSQEGAGRELHEMSLDELRDQRERLEQEIIGRAKTVSAPSEPPSPTQDIDLLG